MDMLDDTMAAPAEPVADAEAQVETAPNELALVKRIQNTIRGDKKHHAPAFKRMRRDMFIAMHGREETYSELNYVANIVGRHIQQKTASLYAKNPKAVARRRETLDFVVWDENPQSLQQAMMGVQMAQQAAAAMPAAPDPMTGEPVMAEDPIPPELQQALEQAQAVIADFQQGMQRRQLATKTGKTLEILFAQALREQKPVDFKTAAKQLVRRACTTGVGYVELGFQREMGPRPGMAEKLADARQRIDHMNRLMAEAQAGDIEQDDAEMAELEATVRAIQSEPEIVLREGLIFDFPQATKVIPDRLCQQLTGFIGARHVAIEYLFSADEIQEMFGVDLKSEGYKGYSADGKSREDSGSANTVAEEAGDADAEIGTTTDNTKDRGLVCVWKYYDKPSGLVYYVADGFAKWLRPPAAPDVFVEDFWPIYALTFNGMENETELFPPSDVTLLLHQQNEYNRSRQGMREHRRAARPRWAYANGSLQDEDIKALTELEPFQAIGIDKPDLAAKISDLLEVIPVPGVDPNLYETGQLFQDTQIVVGAQEAQLGGTSKATATESAIAAGSSASASGSSIDDLDGFLTMLARAAGQILLREMSEEQVKLVAGPGAVWPHLSLAEIASEVFLEVEAGSTGKPNQAIEVQTWERLAPIILQIPGVSPVWFARETIRRADDRVDLTEALTEGLPSMMMMNQMQQPGTGDPATDPNAQGGKGGDNAPKPSGGPSGTNAEFGSNQV